MSGSNHFFIEILGVVGVGFGFGKRRIVGYFLKYKKAVKNIEITLT